MKPHKIKIEFNSQEPTRSQGYEGMAFTIQAVFYSQVEPNKHLKIHDKEGDPVLFPIPGQLDPKVVNDFNPVTVDLPILVSDTSGDSTAIIYGYLERNKVEPVNTP